MALDGKLLARARARLEDVRGGNAAEHERRTEEVYTRLPRVREIDGELRRLFAGIVAVALRERADPNGTLRQIDERSLELRAEKAELLVGAGYPEDWLEDIYSCPKCRDSGFGADGRPCGCLMKLYGEEQARGLSSLLRTGEDRFSDFRLDCYSTEPDPAAGISPRECMALVLDTCVQYAASFGRDSQDLLFRGNTGLGKTFLSACIAREVSRRGFSVVYETSVAAFAAFEDQKFVRGAESAEKVRRILGCDLFILDDLGTEMTTSFTQSALYTIVNSRLSDGKKTIISTNLSAAELAARYSAQTVSRIEGEYDTLLFLGRDVRAVKKERRYGREP